MKNKLDLKRVKKAQMVLRALNHKLRQQILTLIVEKPGITVTELYVMLRIEQSVASQHLAILRVAKILKTERDGKYIMYYVNHDRIKDVATFVEQLLK